MGCSRSSNSSATDNSRSCQNEEENIRVALFFSTSFLVRCFSYLLFCCVFDVVCMFCLLCFPEVYKNLCVFVSLHYKRCVCLRIYPAQSHLSPQPSTISIISHQSSAISHQPSTISHQSSAISHQPSAISHQPSTINPQPSTISHQP